MITHRIARLRAAKKHRHSICYIPHVFTFSNAFLGFLSLAAIINNHLEYAAYCIIIAAVMDLFDGKIARALGATSTFGKELDSLCDAVSFCMAPAMLLYAWFTINSLAVFSYSLILGVFLCSGLARLAIFNAMPTSTRGFFTGLPTTASALFIAFMMLEVIRFTISPWIVLVIVGVLAYLMLSSVPFVSLKRLPDGNALRASLAVFFIGSMVFWVHFWCSIISLYIIINLIIMAGQRAKRSRAAVV